MGTGICSKSRIAIVIGVLVGLLLSGLVTGILNSAPANPDAITVETCRVFENIFEDDDVLFFCGYNVAYASEPTETASSTFLMAIYDTDGTTLLYDRSLNYYQYNIHSIYLDATEAASIAWNSSYYLRIMGNPIYFAQTEDVTMDTLLLGDTNWISGDMETSRGLLESYCRIMASALENALNETLTVSTVDGVKLNSAGRTYFLAAIPYLDYVLTDLFMTTYVDIPGSDDEYGGAYEDATTLEAMLGTEIAEAFTGIGNMFNISQENAAMLWIAFIAVTIMAIVFLSTGNTTIALILSVPILVMGAYIGAIPLALLFIFGAGIVVYLGYHIWLRGQ